ncbi:MAG: NAD(P)H-dependent oxidoreductase subunit E [Nitrosomonas sp.]|nr:NAD(P)H-dependent oxidoreductase subunit E [Nitrosomonas sp.]
MSQCVRTNSDSNPTHILHRLYALQQQFLHISPASIEQVATQFNLPISQVVAVVEFYAFFSRKPLGRYHFLFSNCTSCGYMADDDNWLQTFCQRLGVNPGETRADGLVSVDETSCIGLCDHGASLLVNGLPVTSLGQHKIEQMAQRVTAEVPLTDWPTDWFYVDDNVHQRDLLLNTPWVSGSGIQSALNNGADHALSTIVQSGLRGRGGAGFHTGKKWQFCQQAAGDAHYVVCNADEGEPGTFKDRHLLRHHADEMLEGMTLCAVVIGAEKGLIYLRGEYRYLLPQLQAALTQRRQQGLLGHNILGQSFNFDIEIVIGAGAYICGEESALIESLEGKPGIPRVRPPFPVTHGYLDQPTVVNNVETFIAAAHIMAHGSNWFKASGTTQSTGSKILSVSGDCASPGIYEYPLGISVQRVLDDCGAVDTQAVQVGGPAGTLISAAEFNRTLCFEDLSTGGSFLIFNQQRNLLAISRNFSQFFMHESCGFCTPCRVGTKLLKNSLDKIASGKSTPHDRDEITELSLLIKQHSHCGLGHTAANHILDGLRKFPAVFAPQEKNNAFVPNFDLDAALRDACELSPHDDSPIS